MNREVLLNRGVVLHGVEQGGSVLHEVEHGGSVLHEVDQGGSMLHGVEQEGRKGLLRDFVCAASTGAVPP